MTDMNCPLFWTAFEKYLDDYEGWIKKCGTKVSKVKFRNNRKHFLFMREHGLEPFALTKGVSIPLQKFLINKPEYTQEVMTQVKLGIENGGMSRNQMIYLIRVIQGLPPEQRKVHRLRVYFPNEWETIYNNTQRNDEIVLTYPQWVRIKIESELMRLVEFHQKLKGDD